MLTILRSVEGLPSRQLTSYAHALSRLVQKESVRPTLEEYLPGVVERYEDPKVGLSSLERVRARRDMTAQFVLAGQGGDLVVGANVPTPDTVVSNEGYGRAIDLYGTPFTTYHNGRRQSPQLVGVVSIISGQTLAPDVLPALRLPRRYTSLAGWVDPVLEGRVCEDIAQAVIDAAPPRSFVTVEPSKVIGASQVHDPAGTLFRPTTSQRFRRRRLHAAGTRHAIADGVASKDAYPKLYTID